jgi:predicted Zn-dependent protease
VYAPEQITEAITLFQDGSELSAAADQFGNNIFLLRHGEDRNALLALLENPDWVPVYYDHLYVVYLRVTPQTAHLVDALAVNWDEPLSATPAWPEWYSPNRWPEFFPTVGEDAAAAGLGQLFVTVGNLPQARHFLEIAVAANPNDAAANLYLGIVYRALGNETGAEQAFSRVAPVTLAQPGFHLFAAAIYEKAENNAAAYQAYCEVIRLAGQWDVAVQGVNRNAAALNQPATCTHIP